MALDPRATPEQVFAYLGDPITEATLQTCMQTLRVDPNWRVTLYRAEIGWHLRLWYAPGGTGYIIRLERVDGAQGGHWRRVG
jgi:hypothetical protein